jgi:branched-chain amino acid transport system permease protein
MKRDWIPLLLIPALMILALPLIGSPASWVTLTVAGLAMGLMIFIMASGLTLTFGLMDVLNFGHGAFIAVGAFVAASVMLALSPWMTADSIWLNLAAIGPAILAAMVVSGVLGLGFERIIVRPVYGQHLKQILVTTGGLIVAEQLLKVIWGPDQITLSRPTALRGAFLFGDVAIEKYRVLAVVVGLVVFRGTGADAEPHPAWPADPRRCRKRRDGRGAGAIASAACSSACSWSAPRSRDWAAPCGASIRRR